MSKCHELKTLLGSLTEKGAVALVEKQDKIDLFMSKTGRKIYDYVIEEVIERER